VNVVLSIVIFFSFCNLASGSDKVQPRENAYYQITEIEPDLIEIKIPHTGDVTYKNTSRQILASPLREVPEMIIDVDAIDFEIYADRYVHWQDVHVWDPWDLLVADTDQDGKKEVMGELWYDAPCIFRGFNEKVSGSSVRVKEYGM